MLGLRAGVAWRYALGLVLLLALAALVARYVGWDALLAAWSGLPAPQATAALGLIMGSYALRALRIYDFFRAEASDRYRLCLRLTLQHNALNNLLPMRAGEASFPLLMQRYLRIPVRQSLAALLWFRLLDVHTLVALVLASAGYRWLGWPLAFAALALWMVLPRLGLELMGRLPARWRRSPGVRQLDEYLHWHRRALWRAWLWTVANWAVKIAAFAWLLRQFVDVPWFAALLGSILGDATSVLPVHGVAGAGSYEAGVVAGVLPFGPTPAEALAGAVNLHLFALGTALLGGLVSLALGARARG